MYVLGFGFGLDLPCQKIICIKVVMMTACIHLGTYLILASLSGFL
jgi:hypothetical protein